MRNPKYSPQYQQSSITRRIKLFTYTRPHLRDKQRPVGESLYLLHVEWVEDPLVLGPGDELEGRVGLDVAVDDAVEV